MSGNYLQHLWQRIGAFTTQRVHARQKDTGVWGLVGKTHVKTWTYSNSYTVLMVPLYFFFFKFGAIWYLFVWLVLCFGDRVSALCSPDWVLPSSCLSFPNSWIAGVSTTPGCSSRLCSLHIWVCKSLHEAEKLGVHAGSLEESSCGRGRHSGRADRQKEQKVESITVSPQNLTGDSHSLGSLFCFGKRQ